MTIRELQSNVGTTPDGFWGPQSIAAVQQHLRKLMPKVSPWPKPDDASMLAFFGGPGNEEWLVSIPLGGSWRVGGKKATRTRCHVRVSDSLERIFAELVRQGWNNVLEYDGCFNDRSMRGGTRKSKHAWGAAVDLDARNNGNQTHWPTRAKMPIEVMEVFAKEGWVAAGAFWGRDAMHFEATSL